MTPEVRQKLSDIRTGTGNKKSYPKNKGRHVHRTRAEEKIGRALLPGEVVHHVDGNKQNNNLDNLEVLPNQAEHARQHFKKE